MDKWVWVLIYYIGRKVLATNCGVGGIYIFFVSLIEVGGEWVYNEVLWKASDGYSYWGGISYTTGIGTVIHVWVVVYFILNS